MPSDPIVHLPVHSKCSLLDGACGIDALAARAGELGQPALGLIDHGVMNGAVEFHKAATKHGIKPILGFQAYLCDDVNADAVRYKGNHLTLLAQSDEASATSSSSPPRASSTATGMAKANVDMAALGRHATGVITARAASGGRLCRRLVDDNRRRCWR